MSTSSMSAPPVSGMNETTDAIVLCDDGFDALVASLAKELAGSAVNLQHVELNHCR